MRIPQQPGVSCHRGHGTAQGTQSAANRSQATEPTGAGARPAAIQAQPQAPKSAAEAQRETTGVATGSLFWGGLAIALAFPLVAPAAGLFAAAGAIGWLINKDQERKAAAPVPALSVPVSVTNPNEPVGGAAGTARQSTREHIFELMANVWGTGAICNDTSYRWWLGQLKLVGGDFDALRDKMIAYRDSVEASIKGG